MVDAIYIAHPFDNWYLDLLKAENKPVNKKVKRTVRTHILRLCRHDDRSSPDPTILIRLIHYILGRCLLFKVKRTYVRRSVRTNTFERLSWGHWVI